MYCVKCGVKLQDGVIDCPLCGTPVWNPTGDVGEAGYPCRYPDKSYADRVAGLALIGVILAAVSLSALILCLNTYGGVAWSSYVMLGAALLYIVAFLPGWFRKNSLWSLCRWTLWLFAAICCISVSPPGGIGSCPSPCPW